ncbi:MBL fold metallo-hydrolase [candidate division KSB1 bacterium]|nr:MBL fold metallo-hydrolase [candidate division KSB1 bacterium]
MYFRQIFEPKLAQYAYLIGCQSTGDAILVDPERDIDRYIKIAEKDELTIVAVTDTHIHADYLSGSREFAKRLDVMVYESDEGDKDWKFEWLINSGCKYKMLKHGDTFKIGNIQFDVVHTPGHTPEHICFLVTDKGGDPQVERSPMGILSGDFVFVGDVGRPDLLETAAGMADNMEPSARTLYKSIQEFKKLAGQIQVWPCHGAGSACGKTLGAVPVSTVGYELGFNQSILAASSEDNFVDYILDGQPEPPLYFARMKRDNRNGPEIVGKIPEPVKCRPEDLSKLAGRTDIAVIDTRPWDEFRKGHLPGAFFIPLNEKFNTVAGSYIEEKTPIYLIVDEEKLEEAVTDLIRIGLDNIVGYVPVGTMQDFISQNSGIKTTDEVDVKTLSEMLNTGSLFLLDVRRKSELDETGYIDGAHNITYTRLIPRKNEIPADRKIAVYCRTGLRSAHAASFLERYGYDVVSLAGGIEGWIKAGEKVVKT